MLFDDEDGYIGRFKTCISFAETIALLEIFFYLGPIQFFLTWAMGYHLSNLGRPSYGTALFVGNWLPELLTLRCLGPGRGSYLCIDQNLGY